MGIYSYLFKKYNPKTLGEKLLYGMCSGGIGAAVGCPSELALVRMAADTRLPEAERRNYRGIFDCISRIAREEGPGGLWRGVLVTCQRAMLMGGTQMGCASEAKQRLMTTGYFNEGSIPHVFCGAAIASVIANMVTMPFDVVKSRLQNMPQPVAGELPIYSGMLDCGRKSVAAEGKLEKYTSEILSKYVEVFSFFGKVSRPHWSNSHLILPLACASWTA